MTDQEIIARRLLNQQMGQSKGKQPEDLVSDMVAMQAQEYAMARWAIGLRLPGLRDVDVEHAFNEGRILRTHLMRPTWHFVAPADIRWLLAMTAPRVNQAVSSYYRKYALDEAVFDASQRIITSLLEGGRHLPRTVIKAALAEKGIQTDTIRLSFIMMRAELDALICSGPRAGKQFTYALLEERVPKAQAMTAEEALAQFTRRYFESRGPATLRDFSYWSGLTMKQVRSGLALVEHRLESVTRQEDTYYFPPGPPPDEKGLQKTFLLPDYDEYLMSYRDRSLLMRPGSVIPKNGKGDLLSYHFFIIDGRLNGSWNVPRAGRTDRISLEPYTKLGQREKDELDQAVRRYQAFRET